MSEVRDFLRARLEEETKRLDRWSENATSADVDHTEAVASCRRALASGYRALALHAQGVLEDRHLALWASTYANHPEYRPEWSLIQSS